MGGSRKQRRSKNKKSKLTEEEVFEVPPFETAAEEVREGGHGSKKMTEHLEQESRVKSKQEEEATLAATPLRTMEEDNQEDGSKQVSKKRSRPLRIKATRLEVFDVPSFETSQELVQTFMEGVTYRRVNRWTLLVEILPGKEVHFNGKCDIQVLRGVVDICGYRMSKHNSVSEQLFSLKGYSLLSIQGVLDKNNPSVASAFLMKGFENDWCKGMRKQGSSILGNEITGLGPGPVPNMKIVLEKLGFGLRSPKRAGRVFQALPIWETVFETAALDEAESGLRFAIFGGKGVGKSTLTRWIVNKLLEEFTSVIYVDLDPGQGEFTPPGVISVVEVEEPLLGPNFTHLVIPKMAFYLGSTNVMSTPVAYISAVQTIQQYIDEVLHDRPCVINTMGCTQGLGFDFATQIIHLYRPSDVIEIRAESERRNFTRPLNQTEVCGNRNSFWRTVSRPPMLSPYRYSAIESACANQSSDQDEEWGLNASTLRENVMISYFAEAIGESNDVKSFRDITPLIVPLSSVEIRESSGKNGDEADILRSMESNLVALCYSYENRASFDSFNEDKKTNYWHGYGILRAFDKTKKLLYVNTPVLHEHILCGLTSVVAASGIGLPAQFYTPEDTNSKAASPYAMSSRGSKSKLHKAARKNFVPKVITHGVVKK